MAHVVIFLVVFKSGIYRGFSETDIAIPYLYGSKMALGQMPYRDFAVEYPPLALLFMLIPRLFSSFASDYILGFTLEILCFDLLAVLLITSLSQKLRLPLWKTLAIYTLALLSIGPLIINRFDLIPAVATLAAIYAFIRGNNKTAWAILAVGVMIKIYPVVITPVFLIYELARRRYQRVFSGIFTFALVAGVIAAPFFIISPHGFWESFTYQAQRGLQIESVLASLLLLGQKLGLTTLSVSQASGAIDVVSPLATILANITPALVLISLGTVFWFYYRRQRAVINQTSDKEGILSESYVVSFSLLAMLVFILSNKVLSPQFIIWLCPFIPLVTGRFSRLCWLLFIAIGLMSYLIFPTGYETLKEGDARMIAILLARNAALFGLVIALANSARPPGEKAPPQAMIE